MIGIPAIVDGRKYQSLERVAVRSIGGETIAELSHVPLIKSHEVFRSAAGALEALQRVPSERIYAAMRQAAALLRAKSWRFGTLGREEYCQAVAGSTGYPLSGMDEEIEDIVSMLDNMEAIVGVQLPDEAGGSLDMHGYTRRGHNVGLYPAGDSLLVCVPGNIPSICIYWLLPLSLKRPIILVPPDEDPFTHLTVLEALAAVAPWLAAYVQFIPCTEKTLAAMAQSANQVIMSQSFQATLARPASIARKTHLIHYGRSKLLVSGAWDDAAVDIAEERMTWRCGRTCTGLTSVIVSENAGGFCQALARQLDARLHDGPERLAAFDVETGQKIAALVDSFITSGEAIDVTRQLDGRERVLRDGRRAILLPTVLHVVKPQSKAFGLELPFPFVTVRACESEADAIKASKDTLILSVLGGDNALLERLSYESSIQKLFAGPHVSRGYHPLDPHEGYMVDFLYEKKAVLLS